MKDHEHTYVIRALSGSVICGSSSRRLGLSTPAITSSSMRLYESDVSESERFLFCLFKKKKKNYSIIKNYKLN